MTRGAAGSRPKGVSVGSASEISRGGMRSREFIGRLRDSRVDDQSTTARRKDAARLDEAAGRPLQVIIVLVSRDAYLLNTIPRLPMEVYSETTRGSRLRLGLQEAHLLIAWDSFLRLSKKAWQDTLALTVRIIIAIRLRCTDN